MLRRQLHRTENAYARETFAAAWMGFCGLILTCMTDNTLVYHVYYNNPLFVLLGAAYGVAWAQRHEYADSYVSRSVTVPVSAWGSRLKELDRAAIAASQPLKRIENGAG